MLPNIFIIGPQCAGKTTLIKALSTAETFGAHTKAPPAIINEVVRSVMRAGGYSARDVGTPRWGELQMLTLHAQCKAEEATNGNWFISDRSGLDPIIYTPEDHRLKDQLRQSEEWKRCRQRMREGIVILCQAGNSAWLSADDARLNYKSVLEWESLNHAYEALLNEENVDYHVLQKTVEAVEERVAFVLDFWTMRQSFADTS